MVGQVADTVQQRPTFRRPVVRGALCGALAYLAGLFVTYLLLVVDSEFDLSVFGEGPASTLDWVGWFFYTAHFADVEYRTPTLEGETVTETTNLLGTTVLQVPAAVFYLVPVVLLLAAGFALATLVECNGPVECTQTGGVVVVGYFPLAVAGTFLFQASTETAGQTISQSPNLLSSALLVGIVFPLFCGMAGGYLVAKL